MGTNKKSKKAFNNDNDCATDQDPPIFKLIDDCLMHVFSFLPIPERIRIQRVCRHWQRVAKLPWINMKNFHTDNENLSLDTSDPIPFTVTILKQVLKLCGPSITHFEHAYDSDVKFTLNEFLKILKKFCPNIRSISITNYTYNSIALKYLTEHFGQLTHVSIGGCTTTNEVLVANYLAKNQQLKSIEVANYESSLTGACFSNLNKDVIESITITGCKRFTLENLEKVLPHFTKLHTLAIKENAKLIKNPDRLLKLIPNKSNLRSLTIREYRDTEHSLKEILKYHECLQGFVNLTSLDLRGDRLANDHALKEIGKYCTKLKSVTLHCSKRIKNRGLMHITHLPELEYLDLDSLKKITDRVLINMPKLKTLKCSNCEKMETRGMISLLSSSEYLEYLEIKSCFKIIQSHLIERAKKITNSRSYPVPLVLYIQNIRNRNGTRKETRYSRKLRIIEDVIRFGYISSSSSSSESEAAGCITDSDYICFHDAC